jgi:hypothetical protein
MTRNDMMMNNWLNEVDMICLFVCWLLNGTSAQKGQQCQDYDLNVTKERE